MNDPELEAEIERLKAELEAERKSKVTGIYLIYCT